MKHLVIFASGAGSNAENIINHFNNGNVAKVVAVFTNNVKAGVIDRAKNHNVVVEIFTKDEFLSDVVLNKVRGFNPALIILAGFLLKVPQHLIDSFRGKIINLHPALLPKYGGKGMYGMNVHRSVLENHETETGISIHYVDEHYDNGDLIFQAAIKIDDCTTPGEIAQRINKLEHEHFPQIISKLLTD